MFAEERQLRIARWVTDSGRVSVGELASAFDLTQETIRRDLSLLETEGVLRRVHGGAVAASRVSLAEASLPERQNRNVDAKARIAEAALALVPSSATGSVVLDAGTTTTALAAQLGPACASRASALLLITNALPVATALTGAANIDLEILGGRIRPTTGAAVGPAAVERMSRLRPDIAFLGTNGIDAAFGLSTPDAQEASIKSAFVRSAHRIVVLADATKLGVTALVQFAELDAVDTLITDIEPTGTLREALHEAEVEVLVA
ncbi:DeoR/GlpR family DNA-binding transcription regulator [Tersicoccus sp. Bi-70]|uniref:DeoR/GlpR family DNA-binding transcription regulator n=1 Tax=Tersicoccus sp. Bi-70 TaxID=1897634 RepID=UPI000978D180|nr:DeoR/GlpR family DNA-binding transcription regulator [Tersicoccus sp. Bi-70]OMH32998.1 D-beta-D-heptose 1-phosphate adenosyltransferase [Tersicoccus sp. Bi-70]